MFWDTFYSLCERNGVRPLNVVKAVGIASGAITKWKNGTMPSSTSLNKIAEYFNVTYDYLIGKTDKATELCGLNIKQRRIYLNMTQQQLADKLNINLTTIKMWESGSILPEQNIREPLCEALEMDFDELYNPEQYGEYESESNSNIGHKSHGVKIPVYGKIAAGIPIEAVEDIIDYEEIPERMAKGGDYIALQIQGDSMEPRMYSGDVVIIRKQPSVDSGQIAAVMINGDEATLKKVIIRQGGITLISFNPKYQPMNYSNKEIIELPVTILGQAVEIRGKL